MFSLTLPFFSAHAFGPLANYFNFSSLSFSVYPFRFIFLNYILTTQSGLGITYNIIGTGIWFVKLYPDAQPQL